MGRGKAGWYSDKVFGTETIKGRKFEVKVNSDGEFYAEVDGDVVKSPVLRTLRAKLAHSIAREPLNIPFIQIEFSNWRNPNRSDTIKGVVTGIHSRNRSLLVRYDDGKTEQVSSYNGYEHFLKPDTDLKEYERLKKAEEDARKAREKFVTAHALDMEAIREKAWGELGEKEGE